jgi:hypothetical protein
LEITVFRPFLNMFGRHGTEKTFADQTAEPLNYTTIHTTTRVPRLRLDQEHSNQYVTCDVVTCMQTTESQQDVSPMEISTTNLKVLAEPSNIPSETFFFAEVKTKKNHWYLNSEAGMVRKITTSYRSPTKILDSQDCATQMHDFVRREAIDETPSMQQQLSKTLAFFMCKDPLVPKPAFEAFNYLGGNEQPSII